MLEVLDRRPSLAQASGYSHTLASIDSRSVPVPCFLSLWCPGGLVVNSVALRNELREWTLPGSFLSPSGAHSRTRWMFVECVGWLCKAVHTHAHTHTLPPPSPSLSSSSSSRLFLLPPCVSSFLLVLLGIDYICQAGIVQCFMSAVSLIPP